MSHTFSKNKHENDNSRFYKSPTDRLDLLFAVTKAQAQGSLEQIDVLVMIALIGHRNNKTGRCDPAYPLIAAEIGVSARTVERSIGRLKNFGFLSTIPRSRKGFKLTNQNVLNFDRGEQWLTSSDDHEADPSPMTGQSRHPCGDGGVTGDGTVASPVTYKHSERTNGEGTPVKEPGERTPGHAHADRSHPVDVGSAVGSNVLPATMNRSADGNPSEDQLDEFLAQLEAIYPPASEGADYPPGKDSRRGARNLLRMTLKRGVPFERILDGAQSYRNYIDGTKGDWRSFDGKQHAMSLLRFLKNDSWEELYWEEGQRGSAGFCKRQSASIGTQG